MPIQSTQTIQSVQATFARDAKVRPQQELQAAGSSSDRTVQPATARVWAVRRQATAWRVFEQVVFNTFAPPVLPDGAGEPRERFQLQEDRYNAALIARRITGEFRQLQHGWDKPLTVRHIQIVAELVDAAGQQSGRTLEARATQVLDAHNRLRGVLIDRISTRDIRSLHKACVKLNATPKQELRGNATQHGGNVLKLKPEGERGFGLGRKVHQQDAWAKFHQVLVNTFAPKQNTRWERPNLGIDELAKRKREFEAALAAADSLALTIVQGLKGGDAAAPLLVEHVAQAHQFVSRRGDRATVQDWQHFMASASPVVAMADAQPASPVAKPTAALASSRAATPEASAQAPSDEEVLHADMFLTPTDAAKQRLLPGTLLA